MNKWLLTVSELVTLSDSELMNRHSCTPKFSYLSKISMTALSVLLLWSGIAWVIGVHNWFLILLGLVPLGYVFFRLERSPTSDKYVFLKAVKFTEDPSACSFKSVPQDVITLCLDQGLITRTFNKECECFEYHITKAGDTAYDTLKQIFYKS